MEVAVVSMSLVQFNLFQYLRFLFSAVCFFYYDTGSLRGSSTVRWVSMALGFKGVTMVIWALWLSAVGLVLLSLCICCSVGCLWA